jgi:hypothetical protein
MIDFGAVVLTVFIVSGLLAIAKHSSKKNLEDAVNYSRRLDL